MLDACGVEPPDVVDGVGAAADRRRESPPTFADAGAPTPATTQYFEMLGSRSIVHDGWKATTDHVSQGVVDEERLLEGSRDFDDRPVALFDLDDDFSEAHDVADAAPRRRAARSTLWWNDEAERNHVFPLVDSLVTRVVGVHPSRVPARVAQRVPPRREPGDRRVGAVSHRRLPHHRGRRSSRATRGRALRARRLERRLRDLRA